jgi:hypothetical protein
MLTVSLDGWGGNSSFRSGRDIYATSLELWKTHAAPAAVAAADFLCGPEMSLAGYATVSSQVLDAPLLQYLDDASREPGSWRSDSGDPIVDLGGELLRHCLLASDGEVNEALVRRCFLFRDTFQAIRSGVTGTPVTATRQTA